ncbi:MAG: hypothetical protein M3619_02885 [Myxococcota bacterium]|nr:hypothetical protein [Myxococcota bacterium]
MDTTTAEVLLVSHGYDPRYHDKTSRHGFLERCKNGPIDLLEAFLVCGMPVRAQSDHTAPIIKAAESGKLEHIQLILVGALRANVAARLGIPHTPLTCRAARRLGSIRRPAPRHRSRSRPHGA